MCSLGSFHQDYMYYYPAVRLTDIHSPDQRESKPDNILHAEDYIRPLGFHVERR
jgi:hypothetical protein